MAPMILGKSIIVPSVIELAKESKLGTVPDKYIRLDRDNCMLPIEQTEVDNRNELELPVIDMNGLIDGDEVELKKLHRVCQEWGFFQLINHGVNSSLVEDLKKEIQEFFNKPIEEKKKYWQKENDKEGFGQGFVYSEDQKLEWADMFFLTTFPKHERRPHLFPLLPSTFRDTLENYSNETRKLGRKILECMAKNLGIDSTIIMEAFGEGLQMMRMNYYPACPQPDKVIGLSAHSDAVGLTILLQVNDMNGLQIAKDGKWFLVKPIHNAFVVNVGDILEMLSNGIYKSINHRAIINANKERLSVGTFYSPSLTKEIGPIQELITQENQAKYKRISMIEYWKTFFTRSLNGKSYLDTMKIHELDMPIP